MNATKSIQRIEQDDITDVSFSNCYLITDKKLEVKTVSENIADNGGMAVTLNIMENMKNANYEEYFRNWARIWCLKTSEQYMMMALVNDVHAPNELRANIQPRFFKEWYDTFGVTENDGMYMEPEKRVVVW